MAKGRRIGHAAGFDMRRCITVIVIRWFRPRIAHSSTHTRSRHTQLRACAVTWSVQLGINVVVTTMQRESTVGKRMNASAPFKGKRIGTLGKVPDRYHMGCVLVHLSSFQVCILIYASCSLDIDIASPFHPEISAKIA